MTKKLKFTSLLLLVTSISFAQSIPVHDTTMHIYNSAIVRSKSNISNNRTAPTDSTKTPVRTTTQPKTAGQSFSSALKGKAGQNGEEVALDITKTPVTTTGQARTTLICKSCLSIIKKNSGGGDVNSPAATDSTRKIQNSTITKSRSNVKSN
jgi:hypothetical protein